MFKRLVIIFLFLFVFLSLYNIKNIVLLFKEDTRTINNSEVKLLFREDPSLDELISRLISNKIILNESHFRNYVIDNEIDVNNFAAGKYIILSQTQISSLVNGFLKDDNGNGKSEVKVNVDFNRCKNIQDIASNISKCILADSSEIVSYLSDEKTHVFYGLTAEQMPALFLPQRYLMYFDTDAKRFTSFMAEEYKKFWNEDRIKKMKNIGFNSPSEVVTIASIVYSESKIKNEWPIIAKLYINRINKGMRLQSDPTFKFCWGDKLNGVERLLNKHKEIDCPYNTYKYSGIPPGPICLVSKDVIDSVLNPANVEYIFMCGRPGGKGHNFAVTNTEHEKNVQIYRSWLRKYLLKKNS